MGTGYNRNVSQWSKGEYTDASNTQDDTGILTSHLAVRTDDHAETFAGATRLASDAAGNISATTPQDDPDNLVSDNKGVIETDTDMDVFYIDTGGGPVSLAVTPAWQDRYTCGGNLDVHAALYDINGTLLVESNIQTGTDASLAASLATGRYYLAVQGTGSTASPYTAYGSLGQYFVTGTLAAANDGTIPVPDPMSWILAPQAEGRDHITMTATTASDDSGIVEYRFECISGPAGCSTSTWQADTTYTTTGLQAGASYEYQVYARDAFQNETAASVSTTATTLSNLSPLAIADMTSVDEDSQVTVNVLANDSDPDGDAISIVSVTGANKGTVSWQPGQATITYAHNPKHKGSDSFIYTISDGRSGSASTTVSITLGSSDNGDSGGNTGDGRGGGKGK